MSIKKRTSKKTAPLKVLSLYCHCKEKRPNLTRSTIWIFSSCLTPLWDKPSGGEIYNAVSLGHQAIDAMTYYATQSHYPDT